MKRSALAAVAALALTAGSAHSATNLLTNGSFEAENFFGWTYAGATPQGSPAVVIPYGSNASYPNGAFGEMIPVDNAVSASPDAAGDFAAYFVADAATETLSQTLNLAPGLYTIGFSVYVPFNGFNNANNAAFTGTVAGVNLANFTVDGSTPGVWKAFAGVANIVSAGNYLTAFTYNSGAFPAGDFVVDRVYVVAGNAVPEPATWAMMIGGFGMVGAAFRRRERIVPA